MTAPLSALALNFGVCCDELDLRKLAYDSVVPADQGENNLFADAGTTLESAAAPKGSGYACLLRQQMTSWRAAWSS